MLLRTRPKRATLEYTVDGDDTESVLHLDCSPMFDASFVLEIGDRHVWAERYKRSILGKRRSCNLSVQLQRRSSRTQEDIDKIGLSDSKIGELRFYPPKEGNILFSVFSGERGERAALIADIFISDELFDSLVRALQAGKRPTWLDLEIEKQGVLEYGWEPDGSRGVWKLESTTEPSDVDVEQMEIGTVLFMPMWKRWILSVYSFLD